jgi:hypothetical protein
MKSVKFMMMLSAILLIFPVKAVINIQDNKVQKELKKQFKDETLKFEEITVNNKINGKYYKLQSSVNKSVSYLYLGRVSTKRTAGSAQNQQESADFFDYYILYDAAKSVRKIKIINYQSSHGQMISSPGWLKKLEGYMAGKPLEVGKQVDAISGATISVNNLVFDVKQKTLILNQLD